MASHNNHESCSTPLLTACKLKVDHQRGSRTRLEALSPSQYPDSSLLLIKYHFLPQLISQSFRYQMKTKLKIPPPLQPRLKHKLPRHNFARHCLLPSRDTRLPPLLLISFLPCLHLGGLTPRGTRTNRPISLSAMQSYPLPESLSG